MKNLNKFLKTLIFFLLLTPSYFTQTISNEKLLEYYDRMYPWKPNENQHTYDDTVLTVLGKMGLGTM